MLLKDKIFLPLCAVGAFFVIFLASTSQGHYDKMVDKYPFYAN